MLSDSDLIDQVNPFLNNMPGTWSDPYYPAPYMRMEDQDEDKEDVSPACEIAMTAGDRQIDWCKPGTPNCPMSRELEPTQRADPDISYTERGDVPFGVDFGVSPKKMDTQFFMNLIVLLIFIILLIKLTERL